MFYNLNHGGSQTGGAVQELMTNSNVIFEDAKEASGQLPHLHQCFITTLHVYKICLHTYPETVLGCAWDMWDHHNSMIQHQITQSLVNDQVRALYAEGAQHLPQDVLKFLEFPQAV